MSCEPPIHTSRPILALRDISIKLPHGRTLFDKVNLDIYEGDLVVLIGLSGAGKTTLLKFIAGLLDVTEGGVRVRGQVVWSKPADSASPTPSAGLVFQDRALFDELSARDNVRFAIDHRAIKEQPTKDEDLELLDRLEVPRTTQLANLSGGERQRVALARTLAMKPAVLLFDEPTTGLDPVRSRDVVELILQTNQQRGTTTIVVTHDYQPFLTTGARLALLDMNAGTVREVGSQELESYFATASRSQSATATTDAIPRTIPGLSPLRRWVEAPGEAIISLLVGLVAIGQGWKRPQWKGRYFWHYLRMVCLGTPLLYGMVAGAMLGFVFTTFSFSQIPYSNVLVPLLSEEFLSATGYSTFRIVVPLMIAVLLAGKCGAAIAADVGSRKLAGQFDAMVNLGGSPTAYLHGNAVAAMIVALPIITAAAYLTNCYASMVAYLLASETGTRTTFARNYFSMVWPTHAAWPRGTVWVLSKTLISGWLIGSLSYLIGSRPKYAPPDVSRDVGKTILWASLAVLLAHSIISLIEFD